MAEERGKDLLSFVRRVRLRIRVGFNNYHDPPRLPSTKRLIRIYGKKSESSLDGFIRLPEQHRGMNVVA